MKTFDRTEIEKASMLNRHALYCDRWGVFVFDTPNNYDKEFCLVNEGPRGPAAPQGFGTHLSYTTRTYTGTSVCQTIQSINGRINRDGLRWGLIEQVRGTYAWETYSQKVKNFIEVGASYGVDPYICLGGANPNYGFGLPSGYLGGMPLDSDEVLGFSNYCGYVVAQVPACNKFEIWNEWSIEGFGTVQEQTDNVGLDHTKYLHLVKQCYPKIKAARPDAEVIIGTFTEPYWQSQSGSVWFENVLNSEILDYCTGFSIHHYNGFLPPEYWHDQLYHVIQKIKAKAPRHKVYLSETGWFNGTDTASITEAESAARYSRYPFLLRCLDLDGSMFYDLVNDGTTVAKEENFGFYTWNLGAPKLQAVTVGQALAHVNVSTAARHYSDAGLMRRVVVLDTPTGQRAACWSVNNSGTLKLLVKANAGGTLSIQTMGGSTSTQPLVVGDNIISVTLADTAKVVFANTPVTISTT